MVDIDKHHNHALTVEAYVSTTDEKFMFKSCSKSMKDSCSKTLNKIVPSPAKVMSTGKDTAFKACKKLN